RRDPVHDQARPGHRVRRDPGPEPEGRTGPVPPPAGPDPAPAGPRTGPERPLFLAPAAAPLSAPGSAGIIRQLFRKLAYGIGLAVWRAGTLPAKGGDACDIDWQELRRC